MLLLPVEYFRFEEDFMEDGLRCIPMIVRFKLDACGIKLKLKEWNKMSTYERGQLARLPIDEAQQIMAYGKYVRTRIRNHTGEEATELTVEPTPAWSDTRQIPEAVIQKMDELNGSIDLEQWKQLNVLQRFSLLKLTRPGHENKNFPKAAKEFGLLNEYKLRATDQPVH